MRAAVSNSTETVDLETCWHSDGKKKTTLRDLPKELKSESLSPERYERRHTRLRSANTAIGRWRQRKIQPIPRVQVPNGNSMPAEDMGEMPRQTDLGGSAKRIKANLIDSSSNIKHSQQRKQGRFANSRGQSPDLTSLCAATMKIDIGCECQHAVSTQNIHFSGEYCDWA